MPTYEYRCPECGNEFEKFGKMSDPPVSECPRCGKEAPRKISAGAGLVFKGSGFYITDYRGDGYKKAAEGEKGGASPSSSSDSPSASGGEGKAAPKSDAPSAPSSPPPASGGTSKSE